MFSSVPEYTWGVDMDKQKFKKIFPTIDSVTVIRGFFKNSDAYKKWNVNTIGNIFGDDKKEEKSVKKVSILDVEEDKVEVENKEDNTDNDKSNNDSSQIKKVTIMEGPEIK